ncbi:rhamnose-binding lectin [Strongylocentrotus purpuratus]|uniref:SUEL-type lectin domain-containing protein n=1 Tax=Strongylocentrotus purpuratus TaxID=7668 RepID=A0A7M7GIB0_STRPU|nr:rhamnose-binding lectin [Strongylocentrotus purpuratus]
MAGKTLFCVICMVYLYLGCTTATVVRNCEGNPLSLSCPSGSVLSIISANYGRTTGPETCPHSSIQTTDCYASNSMNIVGNLCNGQTRCTVVATNSVFGDPCVGTYKYLEVNYTCQRRNDIIPTEPTCENRSDCNTERTCEGSSLSLSCSSGSVVNIISANYGRTTGPETCPHSSIRTTACFASNSLNIVGNICNEQTSCTVLATNSVFGDPCVGTYKYLEVKYTCKPGPVSNMKRICEGGSINLSCPSHTPVIVISKAMYGRQVPGSDFCPHISIQTTNCAAPNSLATARSACQGRSVCTMAASNQIFSDPCVGTYKYLEMEYTCARRGRVCEHDILHIGCPPGQKIVVLDAFYGRMAGPDICPHPQTSNQNCRASSSIRIVKDKCNGLSSCTVTASNVVFGDPCVYTFKYLEVLYDCKQI